HYCVRLTCIYAHLFSFFFFLITPRPPTSTLFPYTTLFRSTLSKADNKTLLDGAGAQVLAEPQVAIPPGFVSRDITTLTPGSTTLDRKSTRLNSSHGSISYAVFCLKKKKKQNIIKQDIKKHQ